MKEFQEGAGLVVDGIVGPVTWTALPDGGPMPVLQEGSSGEVVRSLQDPAHQRRFRCMGHDPHGIDGHFGARTKASVQAFQTWGGVAADGVMGSRTSGGLAPRSQCDLGECG